MGQAISPCILNGTVCDNRIPDALCQAFGFDRGESTAAVLSALHTASAMLALLLLALHCPNCSAQRQPPASVRSTPRAMGALLEA